jgi:hypothetical protein
MTKPDNQQTDRSGPFRSSASLDEEKLTALLLVCRELGLSDNECRALKHQTGMLRDFEVNEKNLLKSPSEQRQSIENIQSLADALGQAIQNLDEADRESLADRMAEEGVRSRIANAPAYMGPR